MQKPATGKWFSKIIQVTLYCRSCSRSCRRSCSRWKNVFIYLKHSYIYADKVLPWTRCIRLFGRYYLPN